MLISPTKYNMICTEEQSKICSSFFMEQVPVLDKTKIARTESVMNFRNFLQKFSDHTRKNSVAAGGNFRTTLFNFQLAAGDRELWT